MDFSNRFGSQFWREFRAFFLSWVVMRTKQPTDFRTDLVVFTGEDKLPQLFEMGCSEEGRKCDEEEDRCIAIAHVPMKVSPESTCNIFMHLPLRNPARTNH